MTENSRTGIIAQILSLTDYTKILYGDRHPIQGQMVVTGPQMGYSLEKRIGFCVQIRKNCGQFSSDMVFLRHPDESLTTHENQAYFAMTEVQEKLARTIFTHLPEDEDYSEGYRCCDKVNEIGFLIEKSQSKPMPDTSFALTIAGGNSGSDVSKTLFVHI